MLKRGFSFSFFNKKSSKSSQVRPKIVLYTAKANVFKPNLKKRSTRLAWKPRNKVRAFAEVSGPIFKVSVGVFLVLLVYVLIGSPLFVLTKLEIDGNHLVEASEIEASIFNDGFKSVNAFLFNESKMTKQVLSTVNQIKDIKFKKQVFSHTLLAIVEEHTSTIIWQTNNERFMVNRAGVVYDIASIDSPLVVVEDLKNVPVNLNQKIVTTDFVEFVTAVVSNLPRRTNLSARRILVPETTFEINVVTSEEWTIIFDTTRSVDTQISNLIKVLRTIKSPPSQYVDLRIEDRVYYR